jgi:hypothetical protein
MVYRNRALAKILRAFLGYNIFAGQLALGFARTGRISHFARREQVRHGELA